MNESIVTRKQHYVPCAYLARFSADDDRAARKRRIYRTDSNIENVLVEIPDSESVILKLWPKGVLER